MLYLHFSGRKKLLSSAIRVSLVAVMFVMIASTFTTLSAGRTILDRAFLEALAPLRVGMPRSEVEALVLQSNMRVASTHDTGMLQREALGEFRKELQVHWERAQSGSTGQLVFQSLDIPIGLFAQGNPHEQAEIHVKRRYYMTGAGTYYTLGLRFDAQNRLESASYKREQLSHMKVVQCDVMFQRPATIPSPCDPGSSGKN